MLTAKQTNKRYVEYLEHENVIVTVLYGLLLSSTEKLKILEIQLVIQYGGHCVYCFESRQITCLV